MKEKKTVEQFETREAIARHLNITRMTLYRWERVVPLTSYPGRRVWLDIDELNIWREKLRVEEHRRYMKRIT